MGTRTISASAVIDAPPDVLYTIIADYHEGHPSILPKPPFVSLEVEAGGQGAGTTIRVGMRVLGQLQTFRAEVSEPDPGRILVETNDTGYVTTFTVIPLASGKRSEVTIRTEVDGPDGVVGGLRLWVMKRFLRPVFAEELRLLAAVAQRRTVRARRVRPAQQVVAG